MADNLLEWLAVTPFHAALAVMVVPALTVSLLGMVLIRLVFADEIAGLSGVVSSKSGYMAETYSVLLGLMLAGAYAGYQDMQSTVLGEGQSLRAIIRTADRLPPAEQEAIRAAARDYARAVIDDEWSGLSLDDGKPSAERALDRLFVAGTAVAAGTSLGSPAFLATSQIQDLLRDLLHHRVERLAAGPGRPLASLLSELVLILTLLAVAIPWFIVSRSLLLHLMLSGVLVVTYLSLITLSVELLYPFAGQIALQPDALRAILN